METIMETMGDRIRKRRQELGLSQEELAALLYINRTTLSKYELQNRDMPTELLGRLAITLKTSTDYLIFGRCEKSSWMQEMMSILNQIQEPRMRDIAMKQIKCLLDIPNGDKQ